MADQSKPRVLIVGAGSMGVIVGYFLEHAGADVTFLVRPHRAEALSAPQVLYCYDDNQLKEYKSYSFVTEPEKIVGAGYDFILVTLDAAALENETGQALVQTIGRAARGTKTAVIVGSVFAYLRPWFLELSGLQPEQVAFGSSKVHAYSPQSYTLPVHPPTDGALVAKADVAYADRLGDGMALSDSAPAAASAFAALYNASGLSHCGVISDGQYGVRSDSMFALLAAADVAGWPTIAELVTMGEIWSLGVASAKEIMGLGIHGEVGQQAAATATEAGLADMMINVEKSLLPLDMQVFNRNHHGRKVNAQDLAHLRRCIEFGAAEGKAMVATKELLHRIESRAE